MRTDDLIGTPPHSHEPATRVAVVIPILNEAETLGKTLDALSMQVYPHHLIEIFIVDGGSSDEWQSVVRPFECADLPIRCLPNLKRTTAAAVNLALDSTDAPAILWISGHCVLSPDYISAVVNAFDKYPGAVIGGRLDVAGRGGVSTLNALVLQSRFGTGMAPFRFDTDAGQAETVTYALFSRSLLLSVGGLDEQLVRNQDSDLIGRLRLLGTQFRRINATATYLAPSRMSGIWRRAWGNGAWNIWVLRLGNAGLAWWHMVPMAAVGVGAALLAASVWFPIAGYLLIGLATLYVLLAIGFAWAASRNGPRWTIPVLPVLFFVHHVVYGMGSWQALFRKVPVSSGTHAEASG